MFIHAYYALLCGCFRLVVVDHTHIMLSTRWWHDMDTLSELLAISKENPSVEL